MSRIAECFAALAAQGRKALIPFITAGDPSVAASLELLHAEVAAGADLLELGVPFSDPMAEGPVIQRACERALAAGITLQQIFDLVRQFRLTNQHTPIILMGYLNPIEATGYAQFCQQAAAAGVDGLIVVDMPPEEAEELLSCSRAQQLDMIFLLAPTSSPARIQRICEQASGFVYYVSLKGVTGAAHLDVAAVADKLAQIRACTSLPIAVGFGIKDGASAAQVARLADAVVVGSALVQRVEHHQQNIAGAREAVSELLSDIRTAMDQAVNQQQQ